MNFDRNLLKLAQRNRAILTFAILAGLVGGATAVLIARLLSRVIHEAFLEGAGLAEVGSGLALLLGLIGLRAGLAWGGDLASTALAVRVKSGLRRQLFEHLLALGPAYTSGERTGELVHTAVEGIEALDAYYSQYLPQVALAALVPLTYLAFVFPLDTLSGVVLLITAPLIPVFMILIGSLAETLTRRQWQTLSRLSAHFLDVLQGLTTLKILGRSRAQIQVIAQVSENYRTTTLGVLRVTFLSALVLEMVSTLSTAVVAVEIGLRLLYGRLGFEQAFFVLILAPEFYLPLRMLGTRFHAGMAGVTAARRIFEILNTPLPAPAAEEPPEAGQGAAGMKGTPPHINLQNVTCAYEAGRPALQEASLEIQAGKMTALVGPSGAGKSTIVALLLRFLQPQEGRITVDGQALKELPVESWRERVAWVPQRPYLFNDTVAENIRLAKPSASQAEIEQAARRAYAHDFIQDLPQGYATRIGERGARLSGGQAQRIALARAFLKDASFLILDEATSNLDPEQETLIQQAARELMAGRTTLVIAHRLNTVYQADRILVLSGGQVVETGTHAGLVAQGGLYCRLVQAYAQTETNDVDNEPIRHPKDAGGAAPESAPAPTAAGLEAGPGSGGRLAVLGRLLALVAPFWKWASLAVLAGAATVSSSIGLMSASAYIISAAALHPSIAELQVAIVGVRFFGISRGLFRYLERYLSHEVTLRLLARLRVWFYQALEPLAPARLLAYRSGDLLSRITGDIGALENFYVRTLAPPLVALVVSLGACGFLAAFHPLPGFILLFFLLLAGAGLPLLARRFGRAPGEQLAALRAVLNSTLVDGIQGLADLLANGQAAQYACQVNAASRGVGGLQLRLAYLSAGQNAAGSLLSQVGMVCVLAGSIPLVRQGLIPGVDLAVLTLAALTSFEAVLPLPLAAQYLDGHLEAARRLFEVVTVAPAVVDPPEPLPAPEAFSLSVRGLSFRYPEAAGVDAGFGLEEIQFELPPGKRLAIVGPSGSGKSTLLHLLLRFWEYQQGEICLEDKDLRRYRAEDLRRRIGVVSQQTHLFNATLRDNLLLARPRASQAEIEAAAAQAQIHDFILSLPRGYETWIGEQGLRLSGGERQRLGIARALLKDPPLLALDEATANLDPLTEERILRAILESKAARAVLVITHRLAAMEQMDEILVLQAGRIAERGRHAELLARQGLYRRLWEAQNQLLHV